MTTTATVEIITPAVAETYLALSEGNRPLRQHRVRQYASSMENGLWLLSGEPIIFNGSALINGHHRLRACIESKCNFQSVVVRGVDQAAYDVIDSGLGRTMGDVLAKHQVPNTNVVATMASLYMSYVLGIVGDGQAKQTKITRQAMSKHVLENLDLYEWALAYRQASTNMRLNVPALAVFRMIVGQENHQDQLEEFCCGVVTGANLEYGDPRLALRNWVANTKIRTAPFHLSGIIRAWNAYVAGNALNQVKAWIKGTPFPVANVESRA